MKFKENINVFSNLNLLDFAGFITNFIIFSGDEINKFLNDNWKEIISEFKQLVLGPMRAVKKTFFTGILENLTLSEAFADV